jgi:hypothetical protein
MLWPYPPLSMRRCLSRCAAASIAMPPPLLPRQRLPHCTSIVPAVGCCIVTSLAEPGASLVVSLPLFLLRRLSCGASPAPAACCFADYLDVPPSLLSRRLVVALLPLSLRRSLSLQHLSHCATISLQHRPSQPNKKAYRLLRGSSSINLAQRHGTKGLMWGPRGQFLLAAAMVVMFVLGRWFTSAHIYFWNSTYFLQNKNVVDLNYLDSLKFRRHV